MFMLYNLAASLMASEQLSLGSVLLTLRSLVGLTAVAERASRSNAVAGLATETDVARGR